MAAWTARDSARTSSKRSATWSGRIPRRAGLLADDPEELLLPLGSPHRQPMDRLYPTDLNGHLEAPSEEPHDLAVDEVDVGPHAVHAELEHEGGELGTVELGWTLRPRHPRIGVDLDDEPVGSRSLGSQGKGGNLRRSPGGMRRIDHHRQMGELFELRHRPDVEGVALRAEGADSPFDEDDVLIPLSEEILRRPQELVEGGRWTSAKEDGETGPPRLPEQLEVLHGAGVQLEHVHLLGGDGDVVSLEHLSDGRESDALPGPPEEGEPPVPETLERVRRRPVLVSAPTEDRGAAGGDDFGGLHDLTFGLDRAGAGDDREGVGAHTDASDRHDRPFCAHLVRPRRFSFHVCRPQVMRGPDTMKPGTLGSGFGRSVLCQCCLSASRRPGPGPGKDVPVEDARRDSRRYGLLVEGTCDELGRICTWVSIGTNAVPQTLTISLRLSGLEHPSIAAERLPKALIHRNVPGEGVHALLVAL